MISSLAELLISSPLELLINSPAKLHLISGTESSWSMALQES
jgi:hypothetical protein